MATGASSGRFATAASVAAAAASASSASPTSRYWQAPSMTRRVFATWDDFFAFLGEYQAHTSQVFTRRTGTTVKARNQTLAAAGKGGGALIPEHYEQYSRTLHCTGYKVSAEGKRKRREGDSFAECKAQINATLKQESNGTYRVHVTKAFLVHNHPLTIYGEPTPVWVPAQAAAGSSGDTNSTNDSAVSAGSAAMVALQPAGPSARAAANTPMNKRLRVTPPEDAREESAAPTMSLRDFLARMKAHQTDGSTVESRLARYVKEFDDVDGYVAKIFVDNQKVLSCITMQTKNMRKAFDVFPEVLRVECTSPNETGDVGSSYKLFSLLSHDTFGMWQFVQHAVVENGRVDSWTAAMTQFKTFNPKWASVRAVIIESETAVELSALREALPNARVLLSQFHVVKSMHEAITQHGEELSAWHKDRLCAIVQLLVYAPTELVYRANLRSMADVLGDDTHPFLLYFNETWDSCRDMWSTHRRENVTTFGANEARRLEPTWREIQASVGNAGQRNDMTLDETIVSIQFYQAMVERNYLSKLRRSSNDFVFHTSSSSDNGAQAYDEGMKLLAATVSPHACQLVFPQYAHALGRAQYRFCEPSRGTFFVSAVVLNDAFCDEPGKEFCVEEKQGWQCSCAFMVNHHLPCRHVFYIRRIVRCDSIVPVDTLERRWVLREVCAFFDSDGLTSDDMRVRVREYEEENADGKKDSMADENRNTIVVAPGSWEKFVAAMEVGKRVSLRLMQLDSAEFERALRYYRIVEQNFGGRGLDPRSPTNGATASATPAPAPARQTGAVGRPPLHRARLAPKSATGTTSGGAAPSEASEVPAQATEGSTASREAAAPTLTSPRQSSDLPSLASLNPPVIDLQDESEADEKDEEENGKRDEAGGGHKDGERDNEADKDEEYEEGGPEEKEEVTEDEENQEGDEQGDDAARGDREVRTARRKADRKRSGGSSSPSSAIFPRRSARGRP